MIGRLRGKILEKNPPLLLLDVSGVGYEISAPMTTFYNLPELNQEVSLFTHMIVREDAQLLYGFHSERERSLFRALIKVNGVGPKLALTILSGIEADSFVRCVREGDASSLISIPGIGKKTAERLIIETRDALANWQTYNDNLAMNSELKLTGEDQVMHDAMSALITLGYKPNEAKKAVTQVHIPGINNEELIRLSLKQMVKI